jgi:hypothetical protein
MRALYNTLSRTVLRLTGIVLAFALFFSLPSPRLSHVTNNIGSLIPVIGNADREMQLSAYAQTNSEQSANPNRIVVPLSHPSQPAQIKFQGLSGNISVRGYAGNEVIIESSGEHLRRHDMPDEVRGMRRLTNLAGLTAEEDNNIVTVHSGLGNESLTLQVPTGTSLSLKTLAGTIRVEGVSGDLDVETTNGGITLDQISGSIVAHALNGQVTANVSRLDSGKPSSISTMNGRIELTLPASLRANLTMRSDLGDVYVDQDFDFKLQPGKPGGGAKSEFSGMTKLMADNTIRGAINGGGTEINIRSFNGAILVHKGK